LAALIADLDSQFSGDYYRRGGMNVYLVEHRAMQTPLQHLPQGIGGGGEGIISPHCFGYLGFGGRPARAPAFGGESHIFEIAWRFLGGQFLSTKVGPL
jgi:hypothetical protein